MPERSTRTDGPTPMLFPTPVVVDADVLIRNVDYAVRKGYNPALFGRASAGYTALTGVVLFATPNVMDEVVRHLPDIARRRGDAKRVLQIWNSVVLSHVRVVPVPAEAMGDPLVAAVSILHAGDAPTAALALLLAPAVLATDNRRHFRPLDIPDTETDSIAVDVYALGEMGISINSLSVVPRVAGYAGVLGARKLAGAIGREATLFIGLVVVGALVLYLTNDRSRPLRERLSLAAKEMGPPVMAELEKILAAGQRVAEFAVATGEPSAVTIVARHLAVERPILRTREIVDLLAGHDLRWVPARLELRKARAWLIGQGCFHEVQYGRWGLGYQRAELTTLSDDGEN